MGERRRNLLDVMGHQSHRECVVETVETVDELFSPGKIEAGCRFVEQQEFRRYDQRAGEHHPLSFSTRQRRDPSFREFGTVDPIERRESRCPISGGVCVPPGLQRSVDGAHDDVDGEEVRAKQISERGTHESDTSAKCPNVTAPQRLAEYPEAPFGRVVVQRGNTDERRLSRAVRSEDGPTLAGADRPVDLIENDAVAADDRHVGELDRRVYWCHVRRSTRGGRLDRRFEQSC